MTARLIVVLALVSIGCRGAEPREAPPQVSAPATPVPEARPPLPDLDPDVSAAVDQVLSSAVHPGLTWGKIPEVIADVKPLYDVEPDRLFWFDGKTAVPKLEPALATLAAAGVHGLDPEDYDAALLTEQWRSLKAGTAPAADRALFDLGMSIAIARMLKAVHMGRVDPATMYWGYDNSGKRVPVSSLIQSSRDGSGLEATLDAISPAVTHYARARRMLAVYKERARAGEPEIVPAPAARTNEGRAGPELARPGAGGRASARLRRSRRRSRRDGTYLPALVAAVKRFQGRHGLVNDGVIGAGTIERSTSRWPTASARSSWRWSACAGCRR